MKRLVLLLSLVLPLAACQKPSAPDASASAPANAAATSTPSAAAEAAAAAANSGAPAAASSVAGAAPAAAAPAAPGSAGFDATTGTAGALVPGTDYVEIQGGQPFQPLNGKTEVVEVFNFICPACARFEPLFAAWARKLPANVRMTYVPADFNAQWRPYAQAYVVAAAMGLDAKSHEAVFNAIHVAHALPGETDPPDDAKIAAFYAKYGADPKQFLDAMHSFSTTAKLKRNQQFLLASGVEGTPTIIINGKYRVTGKSDDDVLRITDQLLARERATAGASGAAAAAR
jgi:protein dithiol oxidoreductase (disulfide-forming)